MAPEREDRVCVPSELSELNLSELNLIHEIVSVVDHASIEIERVCPSRRAERVPA
jgi:hypothetical protein